MDFNDIIDFMILHCLQGSKPNNAFKTEPCLKNLRTANDWFHMFWSCYFSFHGCYYYVVAELIIYCLLHIYRMTLMMVCNMIFEEARILLTNCILTCVHTTWNILVGFNLNSFQCIQAESVELVHSFKTILLIGQKCFVKILSVICKINFATNLSFQSHIDNVLVFQKRRFMPLLTAKTHGNLSAE